ncbi:MAG: Eco57I restriction-modification methylase domain-containing protein [Planctomycetota bacterium]
MKHELETERLALQRRLDDSKTQAERNRLGQFATPTRLALDILRLARRLLPPRRAIRFFDPAIGTGSFYSALLSMLDPGRIGWARGVEIDPHYGRPARALWGGRGLDIDLADFTTAPPPSDEADRADLIVCNPPYVRHHHLSSTDKTRLCRATARACGVSLTGRAGLYCHFVGLSHAWLAEGGVAVWLVPGEFMDMNYGARLKYYLLERVTLERIHRFDPSEAQFVDALVSSAVIAYRKVPPPPGHVVRFTSGGTLAEPRLQRDVTADMLTPKRKWSGLATVRPDQPAEPTSLLADLFRIRRGVATGANDFFILSADEADAQGLPEEMLRPILPSPRLLNTDEVDSDGRGFPRIDRPFVLIDCPLPQDEVRRLYPRLWDYLCEGAARGIRDRYLCRHRVPWYAQERRPPAPLLCTCMGRRRGDRPTFRFIVNHSRAVAANGYLMLYPKAALAAVIAGDRAKLRAVWQALAAIDAESLIGVGRVYGGGLHKVEPRELAAAPAAAVLQVVPEAAPIRSLLFPT